MDRTVMPCGTVVTTVTAVKSKPGRPLPLNNTGKAVKHNGHMLRCPLWSCLGDLLRSKKLKIGHILHCNLNRKHKKRVKKIWLKCKRNISSYHPSKFCIHPSMLRSFHLWIYAFIYLSSMLLHHPSINWIPMTHKWSRIVFISNISLCCSLTFNSYLLIWPGLSWGLGCIINAGLNLQIVINRSLLINVFVHVIWSCTTL